MDLTVEEVMEGLFSDEAYDTPSDSVEVEELVSELPEWFDREKHEQGRKFFKEFFLGQSVSMILGFISVFAIPTILEVLVGTAHYNSEITAYKRYMATYFQILSWFDHELKPGTKSWRSLHTVRCQHVRAGKLAQLKGHGTVSQRDVSLTLFAFIGFAVLKPDKFGIRQLKPGDWEGFNHFWAVLGYMIGLQDRYNICRKTFAETHNMCELILRRVYTPCLENIPEYFEHSARVMLNSMSAMHPAIESESLIFYTRYVSDVPGYIYTEEDRLALVDKINKCLNDKPLDTGVDTRDLMENCSLNLKKSQTRLLYLRDYETVEDSPAYKQLTLKAKYKVALLNIIVGFYTTYIGRIIFNFHFHFFVFLSRYLPYVAIWRYGFRNAYTNMFKEDPTDPTPPKPNSEYNKQRKEENWLEGCISILW